MLPCLCPYHFAQLSGAPYLEGKQRLQSQAEVRALSIYRNHWGTKDKCCAHCCSPRGTHLPLLCPPGLRPLGMHRGGPLVLAPPRGGHQERSQAGRREDSPTTWAVHATVSCPSCSSSCSTWLGGSGARSPPGPLRTLLPSLQLGSKVLRFPLHPHYVPFRCTLSCPQPLAPPGI